MKEIYLFCTVDYHTIKLYTTFNNSNYPFKEKYNEHTQNWNYHKQY